MSALLIFPDHRFEIDFISPIAHRESRSARIFFVKAGSFGFPSFQLLADRSLNGLPLLGESRDSIGFFLSSLWSLLSWDKDID